MTIHRAARRPRAPSSDPVAGAVDPRIRREPTGLNLPVIVCALLYWACGGTLITLRHIFAFGTLNYLYTRWHVRHFDTDIESPTMMTLSMAPALLTVLCLWTFGIGRVWTSGREAAQLAFACIGILLSGPPVARQDEYEEAICDALEQSQSDDSEASSRGYVRTIRNRALLHQLRQESGGRHASKDRKGEKLTADKETKGNQRRERRSK